MKKTTIAVATAATLLFGAFVCLPHVRGQQGQPADRTARASQRTSGGAAASTAPALKIAFLDMRLILKEYRKMAEKTQELEAIVNEARAKIGHLQQEYQAVVKSLQEDKIDQDSEEYVARTKKAYQLQNSAKLAQSAAERNKMMHGVKITSEIYADVQAVLKLFCDQNGYTLVIQIDRDAGKTDDYRNYKRPLLEPTFYYRTQNDISVAVLTYLNDRYDAERKAAGIEDNPNPQDADELPTRSIPASPNRKSGSR